MERVLITGASRGIGLALAKQFLQLGFEVIATYRHQPSEALMSMTQHPQLQIVPLSVTDPQSIESMRKTLHGVPISILINNAGVLGPKLQDPSNIDPESWLDTFAVNTIAPLMVSQAMLENLKLSDRPRVVTVSSQMGSLNREASGMHAYRSSKAAVNKVMQVLALEWREWGITVCPIHPGWVRTDMGGDQADISVDESAEGIASFAQSVTLAQSGQFFTWQGEPHPW